MPARVAVLSLVLAGPALAAPPLSPTVDNAAIHDEINAADPMITATPAPVERLIGVAELAEARLEAAVDLEDVADLLTLSVTARKVAYQRTGAGVHLCQILATAEHVLTRPSLPAGLAAEAGDFRDEARAGLVAHKDAPCMQPPPEEKPTEPEPPPVVTPAPVAPTMLVTRTARQSSSMTIAGSVLLGVAGLAAIAIIPVQVRRARAYGDLDVVLAEIEAAGGKTAVQAQQVNDLHAVDAWTQRAKIGLGVSAGVLAAIGVGLVVGGSMRRTSARARVEPYGGPQGAGFTLVGNF